MYRQCTQRLCQSLHLGSTRRWLAHTCTLRVAPAKPIRRLALFWPCRAQSTSMADSEEVQAAVEEVAKATLEDGTPLVHPYSASYGRTNISTILAASDGGRSLAGKTLTVGGWVKSGREQGGGEFFFIQVNDGSIFTDLQVYMPKDVAGQAGGKELTKTGASLLVRGELAETPPEVTQPVELRATAVLHHGPCDPKSYPMSKKKHSMDFLREKAHLRPRTNTIGAVARVRSQLAHATHLFFQQHGFLYVHTPIITASDCEGAGEMFQVTTLLSELEGRSHSTAPVTTTEDVERIQGDVDRKAASIREHKAQMANAEGQGKAEVNKTVQREVNELKALKEDLESAKQQLRYVGGIKRLEDGKSVDYSSDFFHKPAYLTVSGQLNAEYYACALTNVYTFGPTFRAENSHTSRHLAEFWMIEPEMAFCDLRDDMQCAEDYVRHCCRHVLAACAPDLKFLEERVDKDVVSRLRHVADTPFKRVTYTEVIDILQKAVADGVKFEEQDIRWGMDLGSEHERHICEHVFRQPTVVYDYPREIKAFYMKLNADGKTVAAMDVLVPGIGELIGGSQREDDLAVLEQRIEASGMELGPYEGYLDLRRYGGVPHSGFGLGFERLVMFTTGVSNIRDVIPFPRHPGNAAF